MALRFATGGTGQATAATDELIHLPEASDAALLECGRHACGYPLAVFTQGHCLAHSDCLEADGPRHLMCTCFSSLMVMQQFHDAPKHIDSKN
jgi:hypothetical protein